MTPITRIEVQKYLLSVVSLKSVVVHFLGDNTRPNPGAPGRAATRFNTIVVSSAGTPGRWTAVSGSWLSYASIVSGTQGLSTRSRPSSRIAGTRPQSLGNLDQNDAGLSRLLKPKVHPVCDSTPHGYNVHSGQTIKKRSFDDGTEKGLRIRGSDDGDVAIHRFELLRVTGRSISTVSPGPTGVSTMFAWLLIVGSSLSTESE